MNFIAKRIHWLGIALLVAVGSIATALYFDSPARAEKTNAPAAKAVAPYVCPMHPDVTSAKPGKCSKCGMALVASGEAKASGKPEADHAGCGMAEGSADHGCCGGNMDSTKTLPPGHPPVEGYTVEAACPHHASTSTNTPAIKP